MRKILLMIGAVWWGLLLPVIAVGQAPVAFDVASIRPSADQPGQAHIGMQVSGSHARIAYMSLKDYIAVAYGVRLDQIIGPDWIGMQRFDITANLPDGATPLQAPAMLQELLASRFQLIIHRDVRESPAYALTVKKGGAKLQESPMNSAAQDDEKLRAVTYAMNGSSAGVDIDMEGGAFFRLANNRFEIRSATMLQLASALTRFADRPVLDMTSLTGTYDLTLDLVPEDYTAALRRAVQNAGVTRPPQGLRAVDGVSSDPFSGPLQKFGLAFESRKAPLDVIVVDSVRRTPTED
jgi:uncharacterized protein (TIGR03435 family)